jgi:hypothetical protein
MAALPIPKEVRPGVAKLLLLSDEAKQELLKALESAPLSFTYEDLTKNAVERVQTIEQDSAEDIIGVLLSLYLIRNTAKVPLSPFLEDFVEGIEQTELKEILSKVAVDKFKEWLATFLQVKGLAFTARARNKQWAYQNTFCSGEISTDVRPLFETVNGEQPTAIAALVMHTLKIRYHHGNDLRDLFVALDSDDLDKLEDLINEARSQSEQLWPLLDAAKIPYPKNEGE